MSDILNKISIAPAATPSPTVQGTSAATNVIQRSFMLAAGCRCRYATAVYQLSTKTSVPPSAVRIASVGSNNEANSDPAANSHDEDSEL